MQKWYYISTVLVLVSNLIVTIKLTKAVKRGTDRAQESGQARVRRQVRQVRANIAGRGESGSAGKGRRDTDFFAYALIRQNRA